MKIPFRNILSLCFFVVAFLASNASTMNVRLNYALEDFCFEYGVDSLFSIQSPKHTLTFDNDTTTPALPLVSVTVAAPSHKTYLDFSLGFSENPVLYGKIPEKNEMDVPTSETVMEYTSDIPSYDAKSFPEERVIFAGSDEIEGLTLLYFLVSPFRYDASTKVLYLNSEFNINIRFKDLETSSLTSTILPEHIREFISDLCVNSSEIEMLKAPVQTQNEDITGDLDYVIITSRQLSSAFEPLRRWKTMKGVRTEIKCVEDIVSTYSGNDIQQLKIKKYLRQCYRDRGLKYALLAGDNDIVPSLPCYGRVDGYVDKEIPTDLYYACLGTQFDWNRRKNDIYGETNDGITLIPHIFVTRVPVKTRSDVDAFVDKTISYESNPYSGKFLHTMLLSGSELWTGCSKHGRLDAYCQLNDMYDKYIKNALLKYTFFDKRLGETEYPVNVENMQAELSKSYSFISMNCHGNYEAWQLNNKPKLGFNVLNVEGINNKGFSIITTSACSTSKFDISAKCLGGKFLTTRQSGVIAYLGSSRYGWGYKKKPHKLGKSLEYEGTFYRNVFKKPGSAYSFGMLVAKTKAAFRAKSGKDGAYRWLQFALNPFGDPEMPLYSLVPNYLNGIDVEKSTNGVRVNVNGELSTVTVMSMADDGKSFYKVVKCSDEYDFECGDMDVSVCVQRPGYVPFVEEVIADCLYIQNETFEGDTVINRKRVIMGSDVTSAKEPGEVKFRRGKTVIQAKEVELRPGTVIELGAEFEIKTTKQ